MSASLSPQALIRGKKGGEREMSPIPQPKLQFPGADGADVPRWRFGTWKLLALALLAAGCGASAPSRFYTLDSTVTAHNVPAVSYAVLVGPVTVPPAVDRPE